MIEVEYSSSAPPRYHRGELQLKAALSDMPPSPQGYGHKACCRNEKVDNCDPQPVQASFFECPERNPEKPPNSPGIEAGKFGFEFNGCSHRSASAEVRQVE